MRIRLEQMRAMLAKRQDDHRARVAEFLREALPDQTSELSPNEMDRLIADAANRAEPYGLTTGNSFIQFVALMLLLKPDFDEDPTVRQFLLRKDIHPDVRFDLLTDGISRQLRHYADKTNLNW